MSDRLFGDTEHTREHELSNALIGPAIEVRFWTDVGCVSQRLVRVVVIAASSVPRLLLAVVHSYAEFDGWTCAWAFRSLRFHRGDAENAKNSFPKSLQ